MIRGPKKSVSVLLPLALYQTLKARSLENGRTLPAYIRQILRRYVLYLEAHPDNPDEWWIIR